MSHIDQSHTASTGSETPIHARNRSLHNFSSPFPSLIFRFPEKRNRGSEGEIRKFRVSFAPFTCDHFSHAFNVYPCARFFQPKNSLFLFPFWNYERSLTFFSLIKGNERRKGDRIGKKEERREKTFFSPSSFLRRLVCILLFLP